METIYYTYHKEPIKIIGIVPLKRLNYYMRTYNKSKRLYFIKLWLNSFSSKFYYLSYKELFNMVKSLGLNDIDDEIILHTLKNYNPNQEHFMIYTHFEWNYSNLFKDFGTKEKVDNYKRTIRNKHIASNKSDEKTSMILNFFDNNKDVCRREMIEKLKKNISRQKINKVIKEHNITIEKKSKSFVKIEEKLHHLFTYQIHKVNKKITYQLLSEYCGVSLRTFNRYIITSKYKIEIENFNKNL